MFIFHLKRVVVVSLIIAFALPLQAQQLRFVYLQTESGQPFYVRMNDKLLSSSPAGYIILPNLQDGNYQVIVGFPKNEFPEEKFSISVDKNNAGYLLKNLGDKGWNLFNLQTLELIPGNNLKPVAVNNRDTAKVQNDPFASMLATVVKDSSILQKNEPLATTNDSAEANKETVQNPNPEVKNADTNIAATVITPRHCKTFK